MTPENDPIGCPWVIAPAVPELPPIPRIAEDDATPRLLSPGAAALVILLLSAGLWGVIWIAVATLRQCFS
jgi:hypothetical protein